jgi:hypothetical protein
MTPGRLLAIRALLDEWDELVVLGDDATDDELDREAFLGGTLVGCIPALLAEIEQLQAERTEGGRPRIRTFVKPDRMGGRA